MTPEQQAKAFGIPAHFDGWDHYQRSYVRFAAGEAVLTAEEETDSFYFLLSGEMRIYTLSDDGKVYLLTRSRASAEAVLGDVEFLQQRPSPNHVEAATDCTFLRVRYDRMRMEQDLSLYRFLARLLVQKMSAASEGASRRNLYPLPRRFADYLLAASTDGLFTGSYADAASVLGCSYRQLMRIVARFTSDGLLTRTSEGVRLSDRLAASAW